MCIASDSVASATLAMDDLSMEVDEGITIIATYKNIHYTYSLHSKINLVKICYYRWNRQIV